MSNYVIGYMCKVDYHEELPIDELGTKVYPTLESLKENKNCWDECGVYKVKISIDKEEIKGTLL